MDVAASPGIQSGGKKAKDHAAISRIKMVSEFNVEQKFLEQEPLFPLVFWWLLVESDTAWAIWADVLADFEDSVFVWTLQLCKRRWACLCARLHDALCPFAVFMGHVSTVRSRVSCLVRHEHGAPGF